MTTENDKPVSVFGARAAMVSPEQLAQQMASSIANGPQRPDGDFINFSGKRGCYEIGQDKRDTDMDELWLVNVAAFEDGYICWKDGNAAATRLYPMGVPVPPLDRSEHGPFTKSGDGWYDAKAMVIRSLDTGDQGYFKISSVSGVSVFADLQREITARIRSGKGYWPVIAMGKESFTAKGFKNFKPVLEVQGWLNDEGVAKLAEAFDSDEELSIEDLYEDAVSRKTPAKIEPPKTEKVTRNRRAL